MKTLIAILFLSLNAKATNFYVSNTGNDLGNGLTPGTAWQTISKVNASSFAPGDSIFFERGGTWNERLNFPSSGSISSYIVLSAYGSGNKPVLTGLKTLAGMTNAGNVWSAVTSPIVTDINLVMVNGAIKQKARLPNTGYSTASSIANKYQLNTSLTGTPNYTGAEAVVRSSHWVIDVVKISSQSGGVLNFQDSLTYASFSGGANGYFLQNDTRFLDTEGEWVFDSATSTIFVYSASSPLCQYAALDTVVSIVGKSYIKLLNLIIEGGNIATLQITESNNIITENCTIRNSGQIGISAQKSAYLTIQSDTLLNNLSNAIYLRGAHPYAFMTDTCEYATISDNYIKNTGTIAGMGMSNNGRYIGIYVIGTSPTITRNRIDSTGYVGIYFNGKKSLVQNNYLNTYAYVKDDGGGIYTIVGTYINTDYNDSSLVRKNIVLNGLGARPGTSADSYAAGIYLDNFSRRITVDSNTIFNSLSAGFMLHQTTQITASENIVVDSIGDAFYMVGSNSYFSGMQINKNIFYVKSASQYNVLREGGTSFSFLDSNYYSRPISETNNFRTNNTNYSLPGWRTATSQDVHSVGTPSYTTSAIPLFYYNPTFSDSTISLAGTYYDSKSNVFNNSVTLKPFTSVILYKATNNILPASDVRGIKILRIQQL